MVKIVAIAAVLASLTTVAADCSSNPELCETGFDETSLVQLRSIYQHRDGNASEVEDAQDAVKAADSNATIQKYAASVAKRHKAEAVYKALKSIAKTEHDASANVNAVRAAATALVAAKDEEDAWKAAVQASTDAAAEATIADADAAAKHGLKLNATAAHQQAMANLSAARTNLTDTQIVQQQLVNDAAAEAHSQFSLQAKTEAAKALAEQKTSQAQYNDKVKQEQLARKKKWQTHEQSVHEELKAHAKSLNAQKSAEKAAGAGILEQEMAAEAPAPAGDAMPPMLVQEDEKNVTMATYNDTNVLAVKATADSAVQAAETAVDQALSDEQKAKAAAQIAQFAAGKAAVSQKVATDKADAANQKVLHAQHAAAKAARAQREADEAIKQTNFTLTTSNGSNTTAGLAADVSETAYYKQLENVRTSQQTLGDLKLNYTGAYKNATLQKLMDEATADAATANAAATAAATSRAVSDYAKDFEATTSANKSAALANLTFSNSQAHQANKIASQAKGAAAHAAAQAHEYDRKAAGVTLYNSTPGAVTKTTVGEQQAPLG